MIVRAIDVNGDWTFGKGKANYKSDLQALVQVIATRLRSHLADCFFAEQDGIDWFNLIGSKAFLDLKLAVAAVILDTEGVLSIADLIFDLNKERNLLISYSVMSVYGEVSNSFESQEIL